jgi:SAM-dependent methyltransferase
MAVFTPIYRQQDINFLKWSSQTTSESFDVKRIIDRIASLGSSKLVVLDVGGGIGAIAKLLAERFDNVTIDVVDCSALARDNFLTHQRVSLILDDFLEMKILRKYDVIIFRTVLHHLVGVTEKETERIQNRAMARAYQILSDDGVIFVTENFYEPMFGEDLTGKIIFQMTKIKTFASLFRKMGANTAGIGVRFRCFKSWSHLFSIHSYAIVDVRKDVGWTMPLWQRMPFLCAGRYQALLELKITRAQLPQRIKTPWHPA